MVRIQLDIPEEERARFAKQAHREGMTLDAWLIKVARQHVLESDSITATAEPAALRELEDIWRWSDSLNDGIREPDWEEHLRNIEASRLKGLPDI